MEKRSVSFQVSGANSFILLKRLFLANLQYPLVFAREEMNGSPRANEVTGGVSGPRPAAVEFDRKVREMLGVSTRPASVPLPLDESLATLAHEFRDPLATILLALEVIPCDGDPAARRVRTIAEHQAQRVVRIVDDLFDLCAGSRDKLPLRKEVVELPAIVAGATETTAHLLAARGHRLTVSLPAEPVFLVADPLRLAQVLTNLLANAAKFTEPGGHIRLTAEAEAGQAVLRVRDNGQGIAPDLLPRVFDLFWQGPGLGNKGACGLGLGLALVKSLVELHGGSVAACSDGPGTGSEFIVRLPVCTRNA
jgi:signal transduction histidine kinase